MQDEETARIIEISKHLDVIQSNLAKIQAEIIMAKVIAEIMEKYVQGNN